MPTSPPFPAIMRTISQAFSAQFKLRGPFVSVHRPVWERTGTNRDREYLAVLETDNATPYYLNLHERRVAHTLILGMTGRRQEFSTQFPSAERAEVQAAHLHLSTLAEATNRSRRIFGGSYLNVGQDSRDFTINPFSLEPTKENLQFALFILPCVDRGRRSTLPDGLQGGAQAVGLASSACTFSTRSSARLSNFANIVGELKERLHRWTHGVSTAFSLTTPRTAFHFQPFSDLQLPRMERRAECWSRFCSRCPASGKQRDLRSEEARHVQEVCSTRHGSLSATKRSATT